MFLFDDDDDDDGEKRWFFNVSTDVCVSNA